MSKTRAWCFTINNWTDEDPDLCLALYEEHGARYVIWAEEKGESGTEHLQGFVYFKNPRALKGVKRLLPRAHLEQMRGTPKQAADYCRKEDPNPQEYGELPMSAEEKGMNERERYQAAWTLAKEGNFEEIDADIRVRHYGTLKKIRSEYQELPPSIAELDFWWFFGPSGTGKSSTARTENPGAYLKSTNKWWDGYVDQDCVVIDEWSPHHEVLADHLKRWADHHPFAAEVKGGCVAIRPPKLIVTSNYTMEECFKDPANLNPLLRRFKVRQFPEEPSQEVANATSSHFVE